MSTKWLLAESSRTAGVVPNSSSTREKIFQPRQSRFQCQQPAADSQRISSTIDTTTCGTGKSTICPQCTAESAPESTNTIPQFVLETKEQKQGRLMQQCAQRCALAGAKRKSYDLTKQPVLVGSTGILLNLLWRTFLNVLFCSSIGLSQDLRLPKLRLGKYSHKKQRTNGERTEKIPDLCSWCHCPLEVGRNLTAARRCGTTTPADPASGQHPGNQHGKTKEERREGGSTRQKDRPDAPPAGAGT